MVVAVAHRRAGRAASGAEPAEKAAAAWAAGREVWRARVATGVEWVVSWVEAVMWAAGAVTVRECSRFRLRCQSWNKGH